MSALIKLMNTSITYGRVHKLWTCFHKLDAKSGDRHNTVE